jgi:hypothetical protein
MVEHWKKVTTEKAAEIIDAEEMEPASLELLQPEMQPEEYIDTLSSAGKWADAIMVLVRALPAREAVWWGCVCAAEMELVSKNEREVLALKAAEKWAYKPTDENRLNAFLQAQKSDAPSVGTLSCMAVVFSGGKLEMGNDQSVDFDASKFTGIASAVVLISASEKKGDEFNQALQQCLLTGKEIACGGSGRPKKEEA